MSIFYIKNSKFVINCPYESYLACKKTKVICPDLPSYGMRQKYFTYRRAVSVDIPQKSCYHIARYL